MVDITDMAQQRDAEFRELALLERSRALAAATRQAALLHAGDDEVTECEGSRCGEPIPEARRRLIPGVRLCVNCQQRLERGYQP